MAVFGISEFSSLGRMCCPWWKRYEAAVIKLAFSIGERAFLENFTKLPVLSGFNMNSE
jgi:hypothetical protein